MYRTLFDLAGFAIVGWLPLIFLPTWRVTRRLAESAAFPVYLAVLYAAGVAGVFRDMGPGIMADFGTADGVLRLLRSEAVALVAWIHILAFDQVVAALIYRDNMKYRVVPLPVQSVLLVLKLMLGPLGFLSYWAVRVARGRGRLVAWGEREPLPERAPEPARAVVRFREVVAEHTVAKAVVGLWRRERVMVALGVLGFVVAGVSAAVAAANGSWLLGAEGRLLEAVKFDVALGIYFLSLALLVPLAGFTARGRRRWIAWTVGLVLYSYWMENVQAWRGLNPRFSRVAGPVDQILGGVMFLSALGIMVLFVVLLARFFRRDALPDHPALRLALRYAAAAAMIAFGVGIAMSGLQGRQVGAAGDLMAVHAAGFHALQAVPLVALLLGWSPLPTADARRWTHVAGVAWLVVCVGLAAQAAAGRAPLAPTPALALSAVAVTIWAWALAYAWRARRSPPVPVVSAPQS